MMDYYQNFLTQKPLQIDRACQTIDLISIPSTNLSLEGYNIVKFIPASGAATRMFQDMYTYLETKELNKGVQTFLSSLSRFAFFSQLEALHLTTNPPLLIKELLTGVLGYGQLPKALIPFHQYKKTSLTPTEEHIEEARRLFPNQEKHLHFTISKEHEEAFYALVTPLVEKDPTLFIHTSFQKKETDTIAYTMDGRPFVLENGEVFKRPGGHGALIENLNAIDADCIMIKNIDNVCHQDYLDSSIQAKHDLLQTGFTLKQQINSHLSGLRQDKVDFEEVKCFFEDTLKIKLLKPLTKEFALRLLDRPFRVCGVVKNQGEVGGGPFFVNHDDFQDAQILEMAEIDQTNPKNQELLANCQYFNPVDLVCFVKDDQQRKYDLTKYVDKNRFFQSVKSVKGINIRAFEHPGLWNGAMGDWTSVFVEVGIDSFNPVKTVNDLLKKHHQPKI